MNAILSLDIPALLWYMFVLRGGKTIAEQEIMLGEWAAGWFRIHAEGKLAHNTEGGYRNLIFNHIIPRLGGVALAVYARARSSGIWMRPEH